MKTRYNSVDALRIVLAFLIVALHAPFPGWLGYYLEPIERCAVPMFYCITGFFAFDFSSEKIQKKMKRQIKHLTKLAVIGWLAYFIWWCLIEAAAGKSILVLFQKTFSIEGIMNILLFNKPFVGDYIWFLFALIYVEVIYFILARCKQQNRIWLVIIPCMIVYLVFGKYSRVIFDKEFDFYLVRNFMFDTLPFFALGNCIAAYKKNLESIPEWALTIGAVASLVIIYLEKALLINADKYVLSHHFIFSNLLIAIAFLLVLRWPEKGAKLAPIGRKYGVYIYLLHIYFIDFIEIGLNKFGLVPVVYNYMAPLIIFALTMPAAIVLNWFVERKKTSYGKSSII